jgi:hypothetical protein
MHKLLHRKMIALCLMAVMATSDHNLVPPSVGATPLEFALQCYMRHPLSVLSGNLYDATPNVVLPSVPFPQHPMDDGPFETKTEMLSGSVPYPDLFDFSTYDKRNSRPSDLLTSSQSKGYEENNIPSIRLSRFLPSPDLCSAEPFAFITPRAGLLMPPSHEAKRFGVCTPLRASIQFGTSSILKCPSVLASKRHARPSAL